ncbi:hypothetical protein HN014_04345 [Aquimarina sp. TRL1]|uniref:hypothetical protein n=1 Tax=Aquimarina sp. (strain TRL1) TaxID=2736252 RepID=UPI00158DA2FE|nr:hypothetical protein [Aquimarina sp. TRL1]QKX04168.1 hypothetical protein HN014_04345 [Aquimarina sp. TRL1]
MKKELEKEVVEVLKNPNSVDFEHIQDEELSPLNKAVIEKEIAGVTKTKGWNIWKGGSPIQGDNMSEKKIDSSKVMEQEAYKVRNETPLDAPEQEIGEGVDDDSDMGDENLNPNNEGDKEEFELPTDAAKQAADSIFGTVNNLIDLGGGYFVKIKKHKEFYEFDEIIELIDLQNQKNIKRIRLDKEDKAILKPLLVQILKRKAKKLTPERQLMAVVLSILFKKGRAVMEIKAENDLLVERILDIVREEKGYSDRDIESEDDERDILDTAYEEINGKPEPKKEEVPLKEKQVIDPLTVDEEYDEEPRMESSIIEVAEDSAK